MFSGQELQQPVLRVVGVLVLVDEDVAERVRPLLACFGKALEHVVRQHEQVVEVDRVRLEQALLVERVHVGNGLVVERLHTLGVLTGADEAVLRVRDLRVDPTRREPFRIALELLEALLHEPDLVGLVVDREVRAVAETRRLAAKDAAAGGVEGQYPEAAGAAAEQVLEPLSHLAGSLVREGDGQDLIRLRADGVDEVGDPVREDAGLPGACAGDHEQWPFGRQHGLPLHGIQVGEIALGRGDGHVTDASERAWGR